jgi:hypothetical protein
MKEKNLKSALGICDIAFPIFCCHDIHIEMNINRAKKMACNDHNVTLT